MTTPTHRAVSPRGRQRATGHSAVSGSAVIPGRCAASSPESRASGSGPSDHPGMTTASSLQRLVDLGLEHAIDIVGRDRADELVDNGSIAADDERLRHTIDAPLDRGAAVAVDADHAERIAVAA